MYEQQAKHFKQCNYLQHNLPAVILHWLCSTELSLTPECTLHMMMFMWHLPRPAVTEADKPDSSRLDKPDRGRLTACALELPCKDVLFCNIDAADNIVLACTDALPLHCLPEWKM